MHKSMEAATSSSTKDTPKSRNPKSGTPKKKSSQSGQKWFKGTPKSRSSKKLLKSPPVEKTPTKPPTPAGYVEFELDGAFERFSIYEAILCGNSSDFQDDIYPRLNLFGTPDANSSHAEAVGSSQKSKSHKKDSEVAKKGKTPQNNRNKIKSVDTDAKKKSSVCKLPEASYEKVKNYCAVQAPPLPVGYIRYMEVPQEELADEVEYDLDGEDNAWLQLVNLKRKQLSLPAVDFSDMELLMDRLEKESYFQMQSNGIDQGALIDDDAVCCICMDGECQNSNAILFCDMCNLAVHQECYGVPYIPEGQWLCRRCLQSPSRAVDCALCPNKGGAFKQTDDGRWAHVVCAIWIPEVCFANTVFLEPIDSIGNIPPARWRLVCFICKQKGIGACIQCHKSNCYVAFHVTCAQQAGLCMKMDTVRDSSTIQVKKTAYCDNHAPPESDFAKEGEDGAPSPRQKMRQARKLLAEKRSAIPVLSIPTIPSDRVAEISQLVSFSRKNQFIKRLMAYWKLKRQSRNGVPLLRRLQASSTVPHPSKRDGSGHSETKTEESQVYYRYWLRLRQDLERARLLCELVRKREKVKKELIHLKCREVDVRLRPFCIFLLNVLDEICTKDAQGIFAEPVDIKEVPDYLDIVDKPMDLSTIREKINSFEYNNLDEFEADFQLMIDNCLNYNAKDTVFYRAAMRLQEVGGIIIRHARRSIEAIGFDSTTGLHLPERNHTPKVLTDEEIIAKVESCLNDTKRMDLPFDDHLSLLHEVLDETLHLNHPVTRKNKFSKMKNEIIRVRRMRHSKLNKLNSSSPLKQKYKNKQKTLNSLNEKDLSTSSKRGRKSLRGTELKVSGLAKDASEKTKGRRSLRPVQHKRDSSENSSSNPPSPPVLRNSTISLSRTLEEKHMPPAKRLKRSDEKEERRTGKTRARVNSTDSKPEPSLPTENAVDVVKTKERLNSVLKAAVNTGKSSPKNNASPGRSRKEFYSSPTLNSTVHTTANSSPLCKKKILQVTPTKTPTKVCTRRSPSIEDKLLAKESFTASPTRRNSSRAKKLSNSSITINNNVIRNSIIPWNDTVVKDKNCASSERSESGSDVLPWSPKITSNVNSKSKASYGSLSGINSTSKRNTKNSSMQIALNNNEISSGHHTERIIASQPDNNVVTKPESFMVYRSSTRDTDLNSDDDDEDVDEDDDANVNSDSAGSSDNDDESMDGVQDDGDSDSERSLDDANSENSVKKSKEASGASDNEVSDMEESRSQGVSQELRRTRYETSLQVPRNRKGDRIGNTLNTQENVPDGHNCAEKLNDLDDEDLPVCIDAKLKPLDLVWAKCKDGSWYPALIINPETPAGFTQNDISIPQPPDDVLSKRPRNCQETFFLVLCFDTKRTWEWIPRNHLEPLGLDPKTDKHHLINRRSDKRAQGALRKAYEKALLHRNRVNGADRAPSLPS